MPDDTFAKLFLNGRSQAVRLPKAFRMPGDRVRVRRVGRGVLLEPVDIDADEWFSAIDRAGEGAGSIMPGGRRQPRAPKRRIFR